MEDASKRVSTQKAHFTVSAEKASACTLMVGPALVSAEQRASLHFTHRIHASII